MLFRSADLIGARVEAIEGRPTDEVPAALATLRGGTPAFRQSFAQEVVYSSELLHGLGIAASPAQSTWTFRTADGKTLVRTLTGAEPPYD